MATCKTWTQTLDPDSEKSGLRKTLTLKNLDPEKPGLRKTWTMKNLDYEKRGKQLDVKKKRLEDHMLQFINIEILLRRDLQASRKSMMEVFHESI